MDTFMKWFESDQTQLSVRKVTFAVLFIALGLLLLEKDPVANAGYVVILVWIIAVACLTILVIFWSRFHQKNSQWDAHVHWLVRNDPARVQALPKDEPQYLFCSTMNYLFKRLTVFAASYLAIGGAFVLVLPQKLGITYITALPILVAMTIPVIVGGLFIFVVVVSETTFPAFRVVNSPVKK